MGYFPPGYSSLDMCDMRVVKSTATEHLLMLLVQPACRTVELLSNAQGSEMRLLVQPCLLCGLQKSPRIATSIEDSGSRLGLNTLRTAACTTYIRRSQDAPEKSKKPTATLRQLGKALRCDAIECHQPSSWPRWSGVSP